MVDMGQADRTLRSGAVSEPPTMDWTVALAKAAHAMGHNHYMDVPENKIEDLRVVAQSLQRDAERGCWQPKDVPLATLNDLWSRLGDMPVSPDGQIEARFLHFSPGTPRKDIRHWLERQNSQFVGSEALFGQAGSDAVASATLAEAGLDAFLREASEANCNLSAEGGVIHFEDGVAFDVLAARAELAQLRKALDVAHEAMQAQWAVASRFVERHGMDGDDTMSDDLHVEFGEAAGLCHRALDEKHRATPGLAPAGRPEMTSGLQGADDSRISQMVARLCAEQEGRGLGALGAAGAMMAMQEHWVSHLADGQPASIITDDIAHAAEMLGEMGFDLDKQLKAAGLVKKETRGPGL